MSEQRIYIECECKLPSHMVVIEIPEEDDDDLWIFTQMNSRLPIYKRVVVAAKYIIGYQDDLHWAETMISKDKAKEVFQKITNHLNGVK